MAGAAVGAAVSVSVRVRGGLGEARLGGPVSLHSRHGEGKCRGGYG